ncbi:MAG: acyl-CoA dehydrogenase family protein, partial [Acidimicrobiia bacterium]|nr:acyl-CoA dehydrogenase family protein [Acidimicrobiia bacterium]
MDFDLPAEDDPRRLEIRAWLASNPRPAARELRDAGYVVPHWPEPWGLDATIEHRHIIEEELRTADIDLPDNPIGIGWAGPTILAGGTDEQRRRFLPPLLSGEEYWCQ